MLTLFEGQFSFGATVKQVNMLSTWKANKEGNYAVTWTMLGIEFALEFGSTANDKNMQ